jgi:hypothetical protein
VFRNTPEGLTFLGTEWYAIADFHLPPATAPADVRLFDRAMNPVVRFV